jgi:hypothetical protein
VPLSSSVTPSRRQGAAAAEGTKDDIITENERGEGVSI